jgi:DNA-binding transcriptional LysR family regulator
VIVAPYLWKERVKETDLQLLVDLPWIFPDNRCPYSRLIKELFAPLGRVPQKRLVVDQDTTIRKMVTAGAGLCLMTEIEALDAAKQKQALILGARVTDLDLSLLYLKKRANEPIIGELLSYLALQQHFFTNSRTVVRKG